MIYCRNHTSCSNEWWTVLEMDCAYRASSAFFRVHYTFIAIAFQVLHKIVCTVLKSGERTPTTSYISNPYRGGSNGPCSKPVRTLADLAVVIHGLPVPMDSSYKTNAHDCRKLSLISTWNMNSLIVKKNVSAVCIKISKIAGHYLIWL